MSSLYRLIWHSTSLISLVRAAGAAPFQWGHVVPTEDLRYHDCFGEYKCARLEVPLNWLNETDKRTVAIAVIKLPAVVPDDDPTFGGSIITNPGGPADSGVKYVLDDGRNLQQIVDKPGHRHYEIVSFDPRGINNTTPVVDCFHSNHLARAATQMETHGNGGLSRGYETIKYGLGMTEGLSLRCKETEDQYGEILSYVNTPSVARDMVEMVDRIDQLRK
ncbi:hypothetical protein PT974_09899 [Cladobotryum mycophilum]|uniref:Uncharacterized protein n=1 Tax=Cladobotryum mycophilum TaxID=491253 RepID=A0ABR0SHG8_9HYPO